MEVREIAEVLGIEDPHSILMFEVGFLRKLPWMNNVEDDVIYPFSDYEQWLNEHMEGTLGTLWVGLGYTQSYTALIERHRRSDGDGANVTFTPLFFRSTSTRPDRHVIRFIGINSKHGNYGQFDAFAAGARPCNKLFESAFSYESVGSILNFAEIM